MPRPKSLIRRQLSLRRWRWALSHAVLAPLPGVASKLNFYARGVYPSDIADRILEDEGLVVGAEWSAEQQAMVRDLCRFSDVESAPTDSTGLALFLRRTQTVRDVEVLGHTGAIAVPRVSALIYPAPGWPNWNVAKPRLLRKTRGPEGRSVLLSGTVNYFHFFMNDALPLLDYLERLHPPGVSLTALLPGSIPYFAGETLNALAAKFPDLRTATVASDEKVEVDELVYIERRSGNREWCLWDAGLARRLKSILLARTEAREPQKRSKRLFVSRGSARIRRLENEHVLADIARSRGFDIFVPAAENFWEQVRCFDTATEIVSPHGAALANLIWCRRGAHALELFPSNFVKSTYLWIAHRMELTHSALLGSRGDSLLGFSVDPDGFARHLDEMLAAGARGAA